jgi:hypothetical protein
MEKKTDWKALPPKSRWQDFWDSYKWHVILPLLAIFFVVYLIHNYVTYKEPSLNVIMINASTEDPYDASAFSDFLTSYGYDAALNPVSLNAVYQFSDDTSTFATNQALQALNVSIYAGGQDLFFGYGSTFMDFVEDGVLCDLSEILPEELLAQYEDDLLYVTTEDHPTPYPCAVELTAESNSWLDQYGFYESCYFGVFADGDHPDTAAAFAVYLLLKPTSNS